MFKRKLGAVISIFCVLVLTISISSTTVFASEPESEGIVPEISSSEEDVIYIDANDLEWVQAPQTFGAKPPASNTIWSFNNGSYTSSYEFSARVWTGVRFKGDSSYNIKATVSGHSVVNNSGKFTITIYNTKNGKQAEKSFTNGSANYRFTGLSTSEAYCFALSKAADGYNVTGNLTVSR